MPGALVRRFDHSSRIRRATSCQAARCSAARVAIAMEAMRAKLRCTAGSPSMCALVTSQLLIPELRGSPV